MGLLTRYVDQRTLAAIATAASTSFAHGLGLSATSQTNQVIVILQNSTVHAASATPAVLTAEWDSANVTISNGGGAASGPVVATTIWLASFIQ